MWEASQVELHGTYSTGRAVDLAKYIGDTTWAPVIAVFMGTPGPCLVVTLLIDFVPLPDPLKGIKANKLFLAREYYCFVVMTLLAIHQFRTGYVRCSRTLRRESSETHWWWRHSRLGLCMAPSYGLVSHYRSQQCCLCLSGYHWR